MVDTTDNLPVLVPDIDRSPFEGGEPGESSGQETVLFREEAASVLMSIFGAPAQQDYSALFQARNIAALTGGQCAALATVASVKFMITVQDEVDLRNLGYSQAQIDRFKPQEVADILAAGLKDNPAEIAS